LIADPIRAVEKEDYSAGELTLRLNRAVTPKWETCFRKRATSYSANVSSAIVTFSRDRVHIRVDEHFLPQGVEFFKQYCAAANEEYAEQIKKEHQKEINQRRAALQNQVKQQEASQRALEKFSL
jgi:hypothetical protein